MFAMCYADLDHFKEFNDRYSYYDGDRVIRILAKILHDVVKGLCGEEGFVGHIGGDDFIFVIPSQSVGEVCEEIVNIFDLLIPLQYSEQDRRAGYFFGKDRRGQLHRVPLMTVSIGVVTNERRHFTHAAQVSELATEMKSYAKTLEGSVYSDRSPYRQPAGRCDAHLGTHARRARGRSRMNVTCPECRSVFRVDPARIPCGRVRARCSVCGGVITIAAGADARSEFASTRGRSGCAPAPRSGFAPCADARRSRRCAAARRRPECPCAIASRPVAPSAECRGSRCPCASRRHADRGSGSRRLRRVADAKLVGATPIIATPAVPAPRPAPRAASPTPIVAPSAPPPQRHRDAPCDRASSRRHRVAAAPAVGRRRSGTATVRAAGADRATAPSRRAAGCCAAAVGRRAASGAASVRRRGCTARRACGSPAPQPRRHRHRRRQQPLRRSARLRLVRRSIRSWRTIRTRRRSVSRARWCRDIIAYFPQKREEGIRDGTLKQLFREEIKKSYEEYVDQIGRSSPNRRRTSRMR